MKFILVDQTPNSNHLISPTKWELGARLVRDRAP